MSRSLSRIATFASVALVVVIAIDSSTMRGATLEVEPRIAKPRGDFSAAERRTIELFERVSPSVVQVVGLAKDQTTSVNDEDVEAGTGVIWDEIGHIVTNNHVVQGTVALAIRLPSGEVARAKIVGAAPSYDLAVLELQQPRKLPAPVEIGTSSDLKVGQFALAIGNPFGLDQSLTTGVISALKRRIPTSAGRELANVIQTDAAINPGNSGGPLLDSAGRMIGVTAAIVSPSGANNGIGFAIPIDTVNRIVPQLINHGRVPVPGIGVVSAAETFAARLGINGVVIARTIKGSPAEKAGIQGFNLTSGKVGDVIVAADGRDVRRLVDLTDELEQVGVGKKLHLTLSRSGQRRTIEVDIVDRADQK